MQNFLLKLLKFYFIKFCFCNKEKKQERYQCLLHKVQKEGKEYSEHIENSKIQRKPHDTGSAATGHTFLFRFLLKLHSTIDPHSSQRQLQLKDLDGNPASGSERVSNESRASFIEISLNEKKNRKLNQ